MMRLVGEILFQLIKIVGGCTLLVSVQPQLVLLWRGLRYFSQTSLIRVIWTVL